jgi:tetratricopeptide (TPR) repeat protein
VISNNHWEELKPFIERLYIDEGKTFPKIAAILQQAHGFTPTKSQFNKRITKWGLRKNTSKHERRTFLQSQEESSVIEVGTRGKIVRKATRARWEKEFKREGACGKCQTVLLGNPFADGSFAAYSKDVPASIVPEPAWEIQDTAVIQTSIDDSWPWASVDVPGSPKLTRLFEALSIHVPDEIEPLSLSRSSPARSTSTREFISSSELQLLSKDRKAGIHESEPTPFNELYPFPTTIQTESRSTVSTSASSLSVTALRTRINQIKTSIKTFSAILPEHCPMVLQSMEDVADAHFMVGDYTLAEDWWSRIVTIRTRSSGLSHPRTLKAMIQHLKAINLHGGMLTKEAELAAQLLALIPSTCSAADEISTDFYLHRGNALYDAKQYSEANALYRQVLQIRLSHLGPKDPRTLLAMSRLSAGLTMEMQQSGNTLPQLDGAAVEQTIRLARTAMQIHAQNGETFELSGQELLYVMLFVLDQLGHFAEASKLGELEVQRCSQVLGESHPVTLRYLSGLVMSYNQEERFAEAAAAMQTVLRLQAPDHSRLDTLCRLEHLGYSLRGLQRHEEAALHLEKVFDEYIVIVGPVDDELRVIGEALGDSYLKSGQKEVALRFYSIYLEKIQTAEGKHPEQQQRFVRTIQKWMLQAQDGSDDLTRK